jgi:hypothetical protein
MSTNENVLEYTQTPRLENHQIKSATKSATTSKKHELEIEMTKGNVTAGLK